MIFIKMRKFKKKIDLVNDFMNQLLLLSLSIVIIISKSNQEIDHFQYDGAILQKKIIIIIINGAREKRSVLHHSTHENENDVSSFLLLRPQ